MARVDYYSITNPTNPSVKIRPLGGMEPEDDALVAINIDCVEFEVEVTLGADDIKQIVFEAENASSKQKERASANA